MQYNVYLLDVGITVPNGATVLYTDAADGTLVAVNGDLVGHTSLASFNMRSAAERIATMRNIAVGVANAILRLGE